MVKEVGVIKLRKVKLKLTDLQKQATTIALLRKVKLKL